MKIIWFSLCLRIKDVFLVKNVLLCERLALLVFLYYNKVNGKKGAVF